MLKILNKKLILLLLLLWCGGCSTITSKFGITNNAGIFINEDKLNRLYLGIYQTKVFDLLGAPTFINDFNKNKWYYVSQQTWYIAIFKEKLIKQQIIILTFNSDGALTHIEQKNLKDTLSLPYDSSTTDFYYTKKRIKPDLF